MKRILSAAILAFAVAPALPAGAQELSGWDIEADVDGDGIVGPTDIQHVINSALGLNDFGPDAVNRARRQYIVASPRCALAPNPDTGEGACAVVGAVDNFPRPNGRLMVKVGTEVNFRFDRNVEGVWYTGACGLLRSELRLEMRRLPQRDESEGEGEGIGALERGQEERRAGATDGADDPVLDRGEEPVLDGEDLQAIEWTPIGRDGAQAVTCGPRAATADIAVKHLFSQAGDYLVRATVHTAAVPAGELESQDWCGAVRKRDAVLIHVRVLPRALEVTQERFRWQEDRNADAIPDRFGRTLERAADSTFELPEINTPR